MLVGVPGLQTVLLLLEPDDTFRRWFVPVMILFLVPLEIRAVRQWRAVRAFALAPSDS